MRYVALLAPLLANVAYCSSRKDEVNQWLQDNHYNARLSGVDLSVLVPEPAVPDHAYAYDRFGMSSILRSIFAALKSRKPPSPSEEFKDPYVPESQDNYKLGEAYFWGLTGIRDPLKAFEHYKLAAESGDPDAQFMVGVAYATGFLTPNITIDPAKAILYYTFAATSGSVQAQLALHHRYSHGLNVAIDMDRADYYLAQAAKQCYDWHMEDFPLLPVTGRNAWAFGAEFDDGLYGAANYIAPIDDKYYLVEHGPMSLAKMMLMKDLKNQVLPRTVDDAVEKLKFDALDDKNWYSYFQLAKLYRLGLSLAIPQPQAVVENLEECLALDPPDRTFGVVNAFMAWLHIYGGRIDGLPEQDLDAARAHIATGLSRSPKSALLKEAKAVVEFLEDNHEKAIEILESLDPKHHGYNGGMIYAMSLIKSGQTEKAREVLKNLLSYRTPAAHILLGYFWADEDAPESEKSDTRLLLRAGCMGSEDFVGPIRFAQLAYARGDTGGALLGFAVSAELGYEAAAINLADLLDTKHSQIAALSSWPLPQFTAGLERSKHALKWFMRAAPVNIDALAKCADYLLDENGDVFQAMQYLRALARTGMGMAYWKLGWIYEYGFGPIKPDYYLALRYYEWSKETPSASLGMMISLVRLRLKLWWNYPMNPSSS